jgi:hypothetical protein
MEHFVSLIGMLIIEYARPNAMDTSGDLCVREARESWVLQPTISKLIGQYIDSCNDIMQG